MNTFENPVGRKNEHGITLIELLVVMVILALFATLVGGRLFRQVDKGKQLQAKNQIGEFGTVLDTFRLEVGRYPTTEEGLTSLQVRPPNAENWDGPYMAKEIPLDPWNHPYRYVQPGLHGDYDLVSLGADGVDGGEGNDADIVSWK
jgi:general secretion pathway protein G